jgi:hypothetical protein
LTGFVHGLNFRDYPWPEKVATKKLAVPESGTMMAKSARLQTVYASECCANSMHRWMAKAQSKLLPEAMALLAAFPEIDQKTFKSELALRCMKISGRITLWVVSIGRSVLNAHSK